MDIVRTSSESTLLSNKKTPIWGFNMDIVRTGSESRTLPSSRT